MMIHTDFPLMRRSFTVCIFIIVGLSMVFGCGGGGGSKPINPAANNMPTALISSMADTNFKEGENITFNGSATDEEDGDLDGDALVWISDIDGTVGTGSQMTTSALSAGVHQIRLSATDSTGGTHITEPASIEIVSTRFVKVGLQTTGVTDASKAFDGDQTTPALIEWPWGEDGKFDFIHFRAYLGAANTFIFRIALGPSTVGSTLIVDGQTGPDTWQNLSSIDLDAEKIYNLQIPSAQSYKDGDYINLRMRWAGGQTTDSVPIYEIWRADPAFAGPKTSQGVIFSASAFDGNPGTFATVPTFPELLHFKYFVGIADTAVLKMSLDALGNYNTLYIDAENPADTWSTVYRLDFTSTQTSTISVVIPNVQSYLDADGYLSLRALWTGPSADDLKIRELWRSDPFFEGPKTTAGIDDPAFSVDGKLNTGARINYFWDEDGHQDYLQLKTYVGDADTFTFYSSLAQSTAGSLMVIDAEIGDDSWSTLTSISLDSTVNQQPVVITNTHDYTDAEGYLSLRFFWEGGAPGDTVFALINEISQQN